MIGGGEPGYLPSELKSVRDACPSFRTARDSCQLCAGLASRLNWLEEGKEGRLWLGDEREGERGDGE